MALIFNTNFIQQIQIDLARDPENPKYINRLMQFITNGDNNYLRNKISLSSQRFHEVRTQLSKNCLVQIKLAELLTNNSENEAAKQQLKRVGVLIHSSKKPAHYIALGEVYIAMGSLM